jgi:DNA-binding protein HU-beta
MERYGKTALVEAITARTSGLTARQVGQVVDACLAVISERLADGQDVTLTGFGTFRRTERGARSGRHVRTGEPIAIPARTGVRFTPGSELKAAVGKRR